MKRFFNNLKPDGVVRLMLFCWWIVNIIQASFTELANDEAYYWVFAQNLDWGYFDHPPMTALLVWLGNFIGGTLGVRLFFTILQPLYLYIMWILVRPLRPTTKDASLFFVISAALPILQLYGFLAVPDGPLLMFTALFLLCFKRFMEKDSWLNVLLLGLSMAALAYSKYHGALVVVFAFIANAKVFKKPKLYASALLTIILLIPHLLWQYNHDWASFRYHLVGRNGYFRWSYFTEFLLNLFLVFNPMYFPLYIAGWKRGGGDTYPAVRRALYAITAGFVIFFIISSLRGYVQPQWVIPIAFGLIMILFNYARTSRRISRYVLVSGWITIGLVLIVRIVMIFNPTGIKFEVFDNKTSYPEIYDAVGGRPVVFWGSYSGASKYMYYGHGRAFAQPSINYRTSHWEMLDTDSDFIGEKVAIELNPNIAPYKITLSNGATFAWKIIDDFRPVRKVTAIVINGDIPEKICHGDTLELTIRLENPYGYDIEVSPEGTSLALVWGRNKELFHEFDIEDASFTVPARGSVNHDIIFTVPENIPENKDYRVGFVLRYDDLGYWFAGEQHMTDLINCRR